MRFSLSLRASVASRASPSPGLAHGVKTSVVLPSEARRCLLRALSGFCSAVLTPSRSAVSNVDEVFCQRDLSLVAVHKFPREVFRCTKNDVGATLRCIHHEQPNNRTTELRTRGVLCCFYEISHLCAYLESRKTLRYGGVQRPKYIYNIYIYREKSAVETTRLARSRSPIIMYT